MPYRVKDILEMEVAPALGCTEPAAISRGAAAAASVLPIRPVRDYVEADERAFLEAIGLSQIVTAYVKAHTGRLSAVCGCSIAAVAILLATRFSGFQADLTGPSASAHRRGP